MTDKSFDGRVAVVTGGAGSGIGATSQKNSAAEEPPSPLLMSTPRGWRRRSRRSRRSRLPPWPSRATSRATSRWRTCTTPSSERFGRVDVLCNNAGIAAIGSAWRMEMADWQRALDVNVLGVVRGVRAFVPAMVERGSGHIVNTASVAGIYAFSWGAAPYITSKFATFGLSEALARDLHPLGVGVSVLCPGRVATNLGESADLRRSAAGARERVVSLPAGDGRADRRGDCRPAGRRRDHGRHLRDLHAFDRRRHLPHLAGRHRQIPRGGDHELVQPSAASLTKERHRG